MEGIILVGLITYSVVGVVGLELWTRNQRAQLDLGGIAIAISEMKKNIQIYARKRYMYTLLAAGLLAMICILSIFNLMSSFWLIGVAGLASALLLILAGYNYSQSRY